MNKESSFATTLRETFNKAFVYFRSKPQLHFVLLGVVMWFIGRMVFTFGSTWQLNFLAEIMIYTVVAIGLNILLGFSGLVSLATAAFIGFTTNLINVFMNEYGMAFFTASFITLIICGVAGLVVGVLSLKMRGIYLAIATLFVGHIMTEMFRAFDIFNRGFSQSIHNENLMVRFIGGFELSSYVRDHRIHLFTIVVVGLVIAYVIAYNIVKSPTGRSLMAISRSQHAALAMGISVRKYRLLAFVIATLFASFGGVLHAAYFQSTGSATRWGLGTSLMILAIVVVGGMKSLWGMFFGAIVLFGVPAFIFREVPILSGFEDLLAGLLIIGVILFYPHGLARIGPDVKTWLAKRRQRPDEKGGESDG